MRAPRIVAIFLAAGVAAAGCSTTSSTSSTTAPTGIATAESTAAPVETTTVVVGEVVLDLALTIHVERRDSEVTSQREFDDHVATLEQLADLADDHGAILNFELSTVFVQAVDRWGSTFIEDMVGRGHGISQHSGDRSTDGLTGQTRVDELTRQRDAIEAHGVDINYLSGGCSEEPGWVEAAIAAGFSAVTGITEICLSSLSDEALPDGMEWIHECHNASICHDPLHIGTQRWLHPWTTSTSTDWLTDDPNGALVIVSAAEADGLVAMSATGEADAAAAMEQWNTMLATLLAAAVPGQVNLWNLVLSVGPEPDWEVLEAIFADAQTRAATGDVGWVVLSDIVAEAVAEAPTQPADPPVVYTDTTPDLAGNGGGAASGSVCIPPACKPSGATLPQP
ncbi:MAG: hypothetical protein Q7V57_00825 [Actinomycetota bacterium]|nr:hypothetical protein [Actinomycetota bacterium]